MRIHAQQGKEIVVRTLSEIGLLFDLAKVVAEKGINLLAVHGQVEGRDAVIRLVTDDNLRALDALRAHNYAPMEQPVAMVRAPNKPGILRTLAERLAGSDIDIHHISATTSAEADTCLIVLSCSNNDRAVVLLNE